MSDIFFIYSTFPDKKSALAAANRLVENHLAACANIAEEITSVYRWEGQLQQESEVTLIAKTQAEKLDAAMQLIKSLHPYAVPCIVSLPITNGHAPFLDWVKEETK